MIQNVNICFMIFTTKQHNTDERLFHTIQYVPVMTQFVFSDILITDNPYIKGILPKRPYLPCVSMAGRALLAGYHRYSSPLRSRYNMSFVNPQSDLSSDFVITVLFAIPFFYWKVPTLFEALPQHCIHVVVFTTMIGQIVKEIWWVIFKKKLL